MDLCALDCRHRPAPTHQRHHLVLVYSIVWDGMVQMASRKFSNYLPLFLEVRCLVKRNDSWTQASASIRTSCNLSRNTSMLSPMYTNETLRIHSRPSINPVPVKLMANRCTPVIFLPLLAKWNMLKRFVINILWNEPTIFIIDYSANAKRCRWKLKLFAWRY